MTGDAIKQTKVVPIGDLCQIVSRMAGSRRGTADWHFATGHFGRKRAIRRRGGGGTPAVGTGRVSGTAEEVRAEEVRAEEVRAEEERAEEERAEEEHRPLARGPVDRATEEEHRPLAQGGSAEQQRRCGRQRRSSGCERKAGQRNGGEGADGGTPGSGTQKGLRCRRPVSGGPDYIIYYRFCSPRIRIATSRIVVSSNVTTPPSGPGSK